MSKKLLIIIIVIALMFMGIMGAGFFVLWSKIPPPVAPQVAEEVAEEENAQDTIRPIYHLDTFIVNLGDKDVTRFLRVTMDLELSNEKDADEIAKRLSPIRDSILVTVPTKTSKEVTSVEGKNALRDAIVTKLNSVMKDEVITNVYFTEFVIQ